MSETFTSFRVGAFFSTFDQRLSSATEKCKNHKTSCDYSCVPSRRYSVHPPVRGISHLLSFVGL
jgi:hypothetical protein